MDICLFKFILKKKKKKEKEKPFAPAAGPADQGGRIWKRGRGEYPDVNLLSENKISGRRLAEPAAGEPKIIYYQKIKI